MIKADLNDAMAGMNAVITALLATLVGKTGLQGAQTTYLCGQLVANGSVELNGGGLSFWIALAACFDAARLAGSTFAKMDAVRTTATNLAPVSFAGIAVKNFSIRMSLAEQALILAATDFVSRQDIDNFFDQINESFNDAEEVAANNLDNTSYTALLAIHAAVSNDLASRARPLPRMVTYSFPTRLPSLSLAQRIYYDPSRNDELIAENKPIHPLFMPATGAALSA